MKKVLAIVLSLILVLGLAACGSTSSDENTTATTQAGTAEGVDYSSIKIGLICLHDENSTYDNNFISALKEVQSELGLSDDQVLIKTNIPEDDSCYNAAAELAEEGCNVIFADSFGHESYVLQAAKEFPEVQFCHATGTTAHTENVANFHMHLLQFTKAVTLQVLLQAASFRL